ncbi:zinc ABC transporter ATP-binding protein AztA [Arthrobacter sp. 35W]|uniref:zinc ABC transporter ATP-binding protein AztA n=1 Tax=Arthrobacter sp. 35W TaxID=1132441 RepID=UPI0004078752|nr:zinc ABC transporter ATP-binding protein AztA [Arthrobacter sp. 35W]
MTKDQTPAAVIMERVVFGHPGQRLFDGVDLRIPRGQATAVIGSNGSGKSTLLSLLAGTVRPQKGAVRHLVEGGCAMVVQRSSVDDRLPMSVRRCVEMGRWADRGPWGRLRPRDREVVADSMERLGIASLADRQLGELSGGQRQRALVAQGLAQRAGLLLLDEPAAGLDAVAQQWISEAVAAEVARGATVVQATHDLQQAAGADYCVVLDAGRLVAAGPPGQVLAQNRLAPDSALSAPTR